MARTDEVISEGKKKKIENLKLITNLAINRKKNSTNISK